MITRLIGSCCRSRTTAEPRIAADLQRDQACPGLPGPDSALRRSWARTTVTLWALGALPVDDAGDLVGLVQAACRS